MNAVVTIIPLFLIRFGLLGLLNRDALRRAAHFAPMEGKEKVAYWVYQISNLAMLVLLCFLNIAEEPGFLISGFAVFGLGALLLAWSAVGFARPKGNGMNVSGLYRVSRHPMYAAYLVYYLGCALLTRSLLLFALLAVFQFSAHWIILAEERWCLKQFGDDYRRYMQRTRRYL